MSRNSCNSARWLNQDTVSFWFTSGLILSHRVQQHLAEAAILVFVVRTTIYRKPTHTDRLLDQSSYNPTSHKATTIQTLTRRAQLVCDSTDNLTDETNYRNNVFSKNNYNADFVRRNTYKSAEHNATNANPTPVTTATIHYIKGTSETIARILQPYNIRVAHKPITTLRQLLTNDKDKDEPNDRQGAVYKIKCCDCQATYWWDRQKFKYTTDRTQTSD